MRICETDEQGPQKKKPYLTSQPRCPGPGSMYIRTVFDAVVARE